MSFTWITPKMRREQDRQDREVANSIASFVKHIVADGSREHVISYVATASGVQRKCSHRECEINRLPSRGARRSF